MGTLLGTLSGAAYRTRLTDRRCPLNTRLLSQKGTMRWPNSVVCECHPLTEPGPCAAAALEQVYTGGFANGLPHGFGKLRYPSGDMLDGEFNRKCADFYT